MMERVLTIFRRTDWLLFGAVLALSLFGVANLAAVPEQHSLFLKQSLFIGMGVVVFFAVSAFDYRILRSIPALSWWIWGGAVALLTFVMLFGRTVRGAANWLYLGPLSIDPIELVKIGVLLVLATTLAKSHSALVFTGRVVLSATIVLVPIVIALLRPDLGSAIVLGALWFFVVVTLGIPFRTTLLLLLLAAVAATAGWTMFLHDYQKERIVAFMHPEADPFGAAYQTRQAEVAIGSAGLTGRGFASGELSAQLALLPESATDFAFASFVEQTGLFGALLVLTLFAFLLARIERVAQMTTNNFSGIFVLGVVVLLTVEVALNVGMNLGLLPVTGLPMPLLSYGGSHTLVTFALLGFVESIRVNQPQLLTLNRESVADLAVTP
jgi:rod shape determining protein RodA